MADGDRVWLEKRDHGGLFGGLFEPPSREITGANSAEVSAQDAWQQLLLERGLPLPTHWPRPVIVQRTLTHRDLRLEVMRLEVQADTRPGPWWQTRRSLVDIGLSTAVRHVLDAVWSEQPSLFTQK